MNPNSNRESADADRVNTALDALAADDLNTVVPILLDVIKNTPSSYSIFEEDQDALSIKFWDQAAFLHYITWHKNQGTPTKSIRWIGNAYPRAYFYLGFLCAKQGKFDHAIKFLEVGEALEPTNPNFTFEKAFALIPSGRYQEALALYDRVAEIGPFVSAHELAVARRGSGVALIEMGDLDNAEAAFKLSLQFEPENKVALNELLYIEQLRRGGRTNTREAVTSTGTDDPTCAICGRKIQEGVIVLLSKGQATVCKSCVDKYLK